MLATSPHPLSPRSSRPWYRRWWGVVFLVVIALFLSLGFAILFRTVQLVRQFQTGQITLAQISDAETPLIGLSTDDQATLAAAGDHAWLGNASAPIVIVEFGDFNCPYSQRSVAVMKALATQYPRDIKIIWRHLAVIDPTTSPLAAQAAECAREQGNLFFWALHDKLFDLQGDISTNTILAAAQTTGVDLNRFSTCLASGRYATAVRQDTSAGLQLGAKGTPTFYVNGQQVNGHQELTNWRRAIESLLP